MIKVIIVDTVKEFESEQQELVDLLELDCRYAGSFETPDIWLKNGKFAIPFPDKVEYQEKVKDLNWQEISINDIIREEN